MLPSSHTTVRTVPYTAVNDQKPTFKDNLGNKK